MDPHPNLFTGIRKRLRPEVGKNLSMAEWLDGKMAQCVDCIDEFGNGFTAEVNHFYGFAEKIDRVFPDFFFYLAFFSSPMIKWSLSTPFCISAMSAWSLGKIRAPQDKLADMRVGVDVPNHGADAGT